MAVFIFSDLFFYCAWALVHSYKKSDPPAVLRDANGFCYLGYGANFYSFG